MPKHTDGDSFWELFLLFHRRLGVSVETSEVRLFRCLYPVSTSRALMHLILSFILSILLIILKLQSYSSSTVITVS